MSHPAHAKILSFTHITFLPIIRNQAFRTFYWCALAILCIPFSSQGQNIEWSNTQKARNKTNFTRILGENINGVYMLRSRNSRFNKDVILERYRYSLNLEISKPLPLNGKTELEEVFLYEKYLLLFKSVYNPSSNKIDLIVSRMDESLSSLIGEKKLDESPLKSYNDRGDYRIAASDDQSRIICLHTESASKEKFTIKLLGINDKLSTYLNSRINIQHSYENFDINQVRIDNNGNVFFLATLENRNKKRSEPGRFTSYLYGYYQYSDKLIRYPLDSANFDLGRLSLSIDNLNNRVFVNGYYRNREIRSDLGALFLSVNAQTGLKTAHTFQPIDKSFLVRLVAPLNFNLRDVRIRNVVPRSDGGSILVSERVTVEQQPYTTTINGTLQNNYRNVYNYGDVVILSINPDGTHDWAQVIKKSQSSINDRGYFSSFILLVRDKNLHFFFNDDIIGQGDIQEVVVNDKGKLENKKLLTDNKYSALVIPDEAQQISQDALLTTTSRDRRFCLLRISY